MRKLTFLTSLGAALEYYDFVIYAMLAKHLSTLFFANEAPLTALLKTFGIFAIGYLVRPLGGIIIGSRSDRFGRKKNFIFTLFLMAGSTLGIGVLPTYDQIGLVSTGLLILLRTLQGFAYGAELPGAITLLAEHAPPEKRGFHNSLMFFGVALGTFLASLIVAVLTQLLSETQMLSFGWRIPFLVGGLLAFIGAILRRELQETPLFLDTTPSRTPFCLLLKSHLKSLCIGTGLTVFSACFILFYLYIPTYLHEVFHYPLPFVFRVTTLGLIWSAILLPFFGYFSDTIGRSRLLRQGAALMLLSGYGLFYLASLQNTFALISFVFLYQTLAAWLAACYPSLLSELFPTEVRYSGVAFCYNTAFALAGLTPVAASYVLKISSNPLEVSFILSALAMITLIATWFTQDKTGECLG
jgi:MFS family permease